MDLSSVNALGVIAFSCFKFAGYFLAFVLLKSSQPAIQASAILMAGARTVLGVIVGGTLYFGWDALRHKVSGFYNFSLEILPYYLLLILLRIFVWKVTIHFFSRETNLGRGREWRYALGGTLWSSFMDFPAALFAVFILGAVLFC